jgi:class 3 adenylate cyclase
MAGEEVGELALPPGGDDRLRAHPAEIGAGELRGRLVAHAGTSSRAASASALSWARISAGWAAAAPSPFFLDHFYRLASDAILAHDGLVDKTVGDEVIALFFGGISGPNHAAAAVAAAVDLAKRAARADATPSGPIPVGTAVHTGEAFVGATGPAGTIEDFTALGDVVNTTARLASAARAGEVIVSAAAAEAPGSDSLGRRRVEIRGRVEPIEVIVLRPAEAEIGASS